MPSRFHLRQTRRAMLRSVIGATAAVIACQAQAQTKATQADALYQLTPKNGMSCAVCTLFRPPHGCEVVQGDIAPQAWCKFFDLPD